MKNMLEMKPGIEAATRMTLQPFFARPNAKRIKQAIKRSGVFCVVTG